MSAVLEVALSWLAVGLAAAVTFGVFMRKRAAEEREREEDEACYAVLRARRNAGPTPAEACTGEDEYKRPGAGFDIDEEEDHRLDDPRHGQAAGLNRRYQ